jgi:hypothetical protein
MHLIAQCGIIHYPALRRSGNFNYVANKMRLMGRYIRYITQ